MTTHALVQLPPGRRPGSLAMRVLAVLVDGTLPSLVLTGWWALVTRGPISVSHFIVVSVLAVISLLAWGMFVWWSGAQRGATPGMRLLDLEVVDVRDGLPVGWGRFFARQVVYCLLAATVIGLLLMLTWLVLDPARRGWHDRSGGAVVVERAVRRVEVVETTGDPVPPRAATVALPAHLQAGHSFRPASTPGMNGAYAPAHEGQPGGATAWQPPAQPLDVPTWAPPGGPHDLRQGTSQSNSRFGELDWGGGVRDDGWRPPDVSPSPGFAAQPRPIGGPVERPTAEMTMPPPFAEATLPPPQSAPPQSAPPQSAPAQAAPPQGAPPAPEATLPPPGMAPPGQADEGTVLRAPQEQGTVLRPRTPMTPWQVLLEDGRAVPLGAGILVGRNPVAGPGEERFGLIEVADTTRTVSKTHLLVSADHDGPWISDRGSTNGSGVVEADGRFVECPPGQRLAVAEGQLVTYGDHRLIIRRGAV